MRFLTLIIFLMLIANSVFSQRNNIWCFGDSAAINFNNGGIPYPISSSVNSRGSCTSIADDAGNLLFYGFTRAGIVNNSGLIYNNLHQIMQNGDSILGQGWYYEMSIIPDPADDSSYYFFSIGVTTSSLPGLYYSKIEFNTQNPQGEVTQKNIQLLNFQTVDCLLAVKHGNGRDWWVIVRESPVSFPNTNNAWYVLLFSSSGISSFGIQNIGALNGTNSGRLAYDTLSNRICFVNSLYLIETYDFDRCTGIISNPVNIEPQSYIQPSNWNWSCEFSPSGQYLYVSTWINNDSSYLWQFDTWATNIAASKTMIWQSNYPVYYVIGQLKRAPDGKIYLSNGWVDTTGNYQFPYLSNQYYPENMNLSVINAPDLPGSACNFQPYSFYLGGKRTYWGLPNNPDYDLGPLIGSACDTLLGITEELPSVHTELLVYYSAAWQSAFINAHKLHGKNYQLIVIDIMGKQVFTESGALSSQYYTKNLNCSTFSKGMYVATFITEKENLSRKFVIE
jgi:hypothetical protein